MAAKKLNTPLDEAAQPGAPRPLGLILPGGGSRAAYQVGVIKALSELHGDKLGNPCPIVCGTSAGAINSIAVASMCDDFSTLGEILESLWMELTPEDIYRTDWLGISRNAYRLVRSLFNAGVSVGAPLGLLDSRPLRQFLNDRIDFEAVSENIKSGTLNAICITAMDYTENESVNFYQGSPRSAPWQRWRRRGVATPIQVRHLMASSAIPTIFAPQKINNHYYGDGSLRQLAPISPALHLGAKKVLVVPASGYQKDYVHGAKSIRPPAFGEIIGHLLHSAFVDSIELDLERLERINELVSLIPEERKGDIAHKLQPIEAMVISPSEDIDRIAESYTQYLPRSIRTFLKITGSRSADGGVNIASYLLFMQPFVSRLIELGYKDAMAQSESIKQFLES